jgi:carbon-monoxide dehydrogenase small subunit
LAAAPEFIMSHRISLMINRARRDAEVEPRLLLVHFLRDRLGLTGTHVGCETSICGACTILLDGSAVKACTLLAVQADGAEILTIKKINETGSMHPLQESFWNQHGLQCGYCTPGMIMCSHDVLANNPDPDEQQIRSALDGNLCRCTGYQNIVRSVQAAIVQRRERSAGEES